jgi:hypothetical protein
LGTGLSQAGSDVVSKAESNPARRKAPWLDKYVKTDFRSMEIGLQCKPIGRRQED